MPPVVGRRFEQVRETAAGDELSEDRELAGRGIALHARRTREPFVLECREPRHALADQRLERGQLGLDVRALEHFASFAVEGQRSPSQAVDVAR